MAAVPGGDSRKDTCCLIMHAGDPGEAALRCELSKYKASQLTLAVLGVQVPVQFTAERLQLKNSRLAHRACGR